jgi:hypothetical protein
VIFRRLFRSGFLRFCLSRGSNSFTFEEPMQFVGASSGIQDSRFGMLRRIFSALVSSPMPPPNLIFALGFCFCHDANSLPLMRDLSSAAGFGFNDWNFPQHLLQRSEPSVPVWSMQHASLACLASYDQSTDDELVEALVHLPCYCLCPYLDAASQTSLALYTTNWSDELAQWSSMVRWSSAN